MPNIRSAFEPPSILRRLFSAGLLLTCLGWTTAWAAPAPTGVLRLGVNNGVAQSSASYLSLSNASQALADLIGTVSGQKVYWSDGFNGQPTQGYRIDFAFSRPPELSAKLISRGWQLVAAVRDDHGFGTDLIANPCPGKPGQVALGGETLSLINLPANIAPTCVPVDQVWKSSAAVLLTPGPQAPVTKLARQLWGQHGQPAHIVNVQGRDAVVGLLGMMKVNAVGAVPSVLSAKWKAQGGLVLAHEPMPFWALLAAPDVPADLVAKVRAALLGPQSDSVNQLLGIKAWTPGNTADYLSFLKRLEAK